MEYCIFNDFFVIFLYFWLKIIFSETAWSFVLKFDIEVPGGDFYQVCSNHEEICMHEYFGQLFTFLVKKSILLKTLVWLVWNVINIILRGYLTSIFTKHGYFCICSIFFGILLLFLVERNLSYEKCLPVSKYYVVTTNWQQCTYVSWNHTEICICAFLVILFPFSGSGKIINVVLWTEVYIRTDQYLDPGYFHMS